MKGPIGSLGNRQAFAKNLQYYMLRADKDRRAVCKDLDLKYSTFSDWCSGKVYPRIDKIELLANYFGIEKSDLVEPMEIKEAKQKRQAMQAMQGVTPSLKSGSTETESVDIPLQLLGITDALAAVLAEKDPKRAELVKEVMRLDKEQVDSFLNIIKIVNIKSQK